MQSISKEEVHQWIQQLICKLAHINPRDFELEVGIEARKLVDIDLTLILVGKIQCIGLQIDLPVIKFSQTDDGYMLIEESLVTIARVANVISDAILHSVERLTMDES